MDFLNRSLEKKYTPPSLVIEILIMMAFNIAVYIVTSKIDLFESLHQFSRQYENYQLDEIIPLLFSITLTMFVFSARRFGENRRLRKLIDELSMQNQYSGLYNRDYYLDFLASELERRFRSGNDLSLIFIKVNGLDRDTDNIGEPHVEQVMLELSKIVETTSRNIDMMARWSQNELILLCCDTKLAGAGVLSEKIRNKLKEFIFSNLDAVVDIGVAGATDEKNPADLINRAQVNLRKITLDNSHHNSVAA